MIVRLWSFVCVLLMALVWCGTAEAQRGRTYYDLVNVATPTPNAPAQVTWPFFDDCSVGNEFDRQRCARGRPARRSQAGHTLWRSSFFAQGLVTVGRYDFAHRRFEVTVAGILNGPVVRRGGDAFGYLSTAPTSGGRPHPQVIHRQYVSLQNENDAELWQRRNSRLDRLRVGVIYRLGGSWTDTLPGRFRVWDARARRYRVGSRQLHGMTMRIAGLEVFNIDTREVVAQIPGPATRQGFVVPPPAPPRPTVEQEPDTDSEGGLDVEDQDEHQGGEPQVAPVAPPSSGVRLPGVVGLSVGAWHTCVVAPSGAVLCWGSNSNGQLGDGSRASRSVPTLVAGLEPVRQVVASYEHTCALQVDGTVRCWGHNIAGELGNGTDSSSPVPTRVSGLSDVAQIALGRRHSCARLTNGLVRCWGINEDGQVGDGTDVTRPTPVLVQRVLPAIQIAAGAYHTCALLADHTVRCWGSNEYGQLGDGTAEPSPGAVTVAGLTDVVEITCGTQHSCARVADGSLRCWGANTAGQLGDGTTVDHRSPAAVPGIIRAAQVAAGGYTTCARLTDGTTQCWGENSYGQLGDGTGILRPSPTVVVGLTGVAEIVPGRAEISCARTSGMAAVCWGTWYGGTGAVEVHNRPVAMY